MQWFSAAEQRSLSGAGFAVVNASEWDTLYNKTERGWCIACKHRDLGFSESFINKTSANVNQPETEVELQETEEQKAAWKQEM